MVFKAVWRVHKVRHLGTLVPVQKPLFDAVLDAPGPSARSAALAPVLALLRLGAGSASAASAMSLDDASKVRAVWSRRRG